MRARLGIVVLVAACGSTSAPTPTLANRPSAPAPPTCADVGVILRGEVDAEHPEQAGPAREAAIAQACEHDHWKPEVIACVSSGAHPQACVDKLTAPQREGYQAKLAAWAGQYGGGMYGGDMYGGDPGADEVAVLDCQDAIGDTSRYLPALDPKDAAHDWKLKLRTSIVAEACEDPGWTEAAKHCVQDASDGVAIEQCLRDDSSHGALAAKLTAVDALATKIAAAKQKPATITCAKLVAEHYGDAKWKDRLTTLKPADRKKAIKESRERMTKTCTADKWDDTLRACLAVGGDAQCYVGASKPDAFGYPAAGVVIAGTPAACLEYKASIDKLQSCDRMPQATRDALKQAFEQASSAWANLPPEAQASLADACKAGNDAITQSAKAMCGW